MQVWLRRVYDIKRDGEGYRVLVDRLWPRGIRKDELGLDEWCKDAAPSTPLRQWFGHDPQKFAEFEQKYREELTREPGDAAVAHLREVAERGRVTLLYAAKDDEHNHALILRKVLRESGE